MIKKIFIILLLALTSSAQSKLSDKTWLAIAKETARDGDKNDEKEFKFAVEAMLHIEDDQDASNAAIAISRTWAPNPKIGDDASYSNLMQMKRYPQLRTKTDIIEALEDLFIKHREFLINTAKIDILDVEENFSILNPEE